MRFWLRSRSLALGAVSLSAVAALSLGWAARPALALDAGEVARLNTELVGEQEIPGPGDLDGFGEVNIALVKSGDAMAQVCVLLTVEDITPATQAHIHRGARGTAGPVVVTLPSPNTGAAAGCQDIPLALATDIANHPDQFYVNVHNADFPDGALRGQLRFDE